jgi:hypothetical protein
MQRSNTTSEIEVRRIQLENKVKNAQNLKLKIRNYSQRLDQSYRNGELSSVQYRENKNRVLKGRSISTWIKYYDDCITYYNQEIKNLKKESTKKNMLLPFGIVLALLLIFSSVIFLGTNILSSDINIQESIIGFTVDNSIVEEVAEIPIDSDSIDSEPQGAPAEPELIAEIPEQVIEETVEEAVEEAVEETVEETVEEVVEEIVEEIVEEVVEEIVEETEEETEEEIVEETIDLNITQLDIPSNESIGDETNNESIESIEIILEEINISLVNFTLTNNTLFNETQNITLDNGTIIFVEESLVQHAAILGQPVAWTKTVSTGEEVVGLEIEIDGDATNITILEVNSTEDTRTDITQDVLVTEDTISLSFFGNLLASLKDIFSFTGYSVFSPENANLTLIINEPVEEILVEYTTPAPTSYEEKINLGKRIIISSEEHYENILSFTNVEERRGNNHSLYWIVNGSRVEHNFTQYDLNQNNLTDYIEWITPHTSNETFEEIAGTSDATNPPVIDSLILNATTSSNESGDNLTAHVTTSDGDGDDVKVIYNWINSSSSLTVLNMPFEKINDSNSDNAHDYSTYGNNGSEKGSVSWGATSGIDGKGAYNFDGVDDHIEIAHDSSHNLVDFVTIELWFNPSISYDSSLSDYIVLVSRQDGGDDTYGLFINPDGKLHFGSQGGNIQSTQASWSSGTWYHIIGTYRDVGGTRTGELYINGVQETLSVDSYDNMAGSTSPLGIGYDNGNDFFNGTIDEVRIYDYTLSSDQVYALYQNRTNEITQIQTEGGQNWSVVGTPNDGFIDGSSVSSENLTIVDGGYNCPEDSGIVTISTDTTWTESYVCSSVTITNDAVLTFDSRTNDNKSINLTANSLTIDLGSEITANDKGYLANQGPGAGTVGDSGGSYGGTGGGTSRGPYGSIIEPTDLGSGSSTGNDGGGAIFLNISGTSTIDGKLTSNGTGGAGAGAGGSIYIITDTLTGSGPITASGGQGTFSGDGAGGGGRIAVYYDTYSFTGTIEATGGDSTGDGNEGGAGTVYLKDNAQDYGSLMIINQPDFTVDDETILNSSFLGGNHLVNLTITNGSDVDINSYLNITNLKILSSSKLTHSRNTDSIVYRLNISVVNLTIDETSSVNVDDLGYSANNGPGAGSSGDAGGSYGGTGGSSTNGPYGSITTPYELGSGSSTGEDGGGAIFINVSNTLNVTGKITSNGTGGAGAGAGGSIYLITGDLFGTGSITAGGGQASLTGDGAGGGGRIAVYYDTNNFVGRIEAAGGDGPSTTNRGGSGTVYLKDRAQDYGSLEIINQRDFSATDEETIINSTFLDGDSLVELIISNGSDVDINSYLNLTTLRVLEGSKLTHGDNSDSDLYRINITAVNVTVDESSTIDVLSMGYSGGNGPGKGTGTDSAGSYGGTGGETTLGPYGSIISPLDLGSGGQDAAGDGGGVILLNVSNTLNITGSVSANGTTKNGAGSGGSIYLIADQIVGNGKIHSTGGRTGLSGAAGGGGGRIAVYYNSNNFVGVIGSLGGASTASTGNRGGAGTVYLKDKNQDFGSLKVINEFGFSATDEETIINSTFLGGNHLVELSVFNGSDVDVNSYLNLTTLNVLEGSRLTHGDNSDSDLYRINITAVNVTVDSSSSIDVLSMGYAGQNGLGKGTATDSGGSYGGTGGGTNLGPYGSIISPLDLGSGGQDAAGDGGGVVFINISDTLNLTGFISANGTSKNGAGSGGSIYLITDKFIGDGNIQSTGGRTSISGDSAGGGGRIAVYYNSNSFTGVIKALGGASTASTENRGGGGTIYLKDRNYAYGDLMITNEVSYTTDDPTIINSTFLGGSQVRNLTVVNGSDVDFDSYLNISYLKISNFSKVSHQVNDDTQNWIINLSAKDLFLDNSSSINVLGLGYSTNNGPAPGNGGDDGGSYGGAGGGSTGVLSYGSITTPFDLGSGGHSGGGGGGAIFLNISNLITIEGKINANGSDGGGSGSGGSIFIITDSLEGEGTVISNGGRSSLAGDGSGGGGRVAIYSKTNSFRGEIEAAATTPGTGGSKGTNGSVFICDTLSGVSCFGSGSSEFVSQTSSIIVRTNYTVNTTVTVQHTIDSLWTQGVLNWSDNSSDFSQVATYNVTGLYGSTNYNIYENGILNSSLSTDSDGELPPFSILLDTNHNISLVAGNIPPEKLAPLLNVSLAYTNTFVNVSGIYTDSDADLGVVFFNLSVNDTFVSSQSFNDVSSGSSVSWVVDGSNWSKNDNLSFWAQAFDGSTYSGLNNTNLTVNNTFPEISGVLLNASSSENITTDNLIAHVTASDLDSDSLTYHFVWYVNGTSVFSEINSTGTTSVLSTGNYSASDIANVSVIANDGEANSSLVWSNNLTLIVANTGPNAPNGVLNESSLYTNSFVNVSFNYTDVDSDIGTVYFNLSSNGTFIASETFSSVSNGSSVSWIVNPNNWSKNDNLSFWVQSYDGSVYSGLNTTNLTVKNSLPVVSHVFINSSSSQNYSNGSLSSFVNVSSDSDSDSLTYHFVWYNNGTSVYSISNSTGNTSLLNVGNFSSNDTLNVSIIANDGQDNSTIAWSNNLTIIPIPTIEEEVGSSSSSSSSSSDGSLVEEEGPIDEIEGEFYAAPSLEGSDDGISEILDTTLFISSKHKKKSPSETLPVDITLISINVDEIDATLNYIIYDQKGRIILEEKEILTVAGQRELNKLFEIPEGSNSGKHTFGLEVISAHAVEVRSTEFDIVPKNGKNQELNLLFIVLIGIIILSISTFLAFGLKEDNRFGGIYRKE